MEDIHGEVQAWDLMIIAFIPAQIISLNVDLSLQESSQFNQFLRYFWRY